MNGRLEKFTVDTRRLGTTFVVIGSISLVVCILLIVQTAVYLATSSFTTGTVVAYREVPSKDPASPNYYPHVTFATQSGECSNSSRYSAAAAIHTESEKSCQSFMTQPIPRALRSMTLTTYGFAPASPAWCPSSSLRQDAPSCALETHQSVAQVPIELPEREDYAEQIDAGQPQTTRLALRRAAHEGLDTWPG